MLVNLHPSHEISFSNDNIGTIVPDDPVDYVIISENKRIRNENIVIVFVLLLE
jgi:hypothetical protein